MSAGVKYDQNKPPWELLPWREVEQIVQVLGHGAGKYPEPDNWKRVRPVSRYWGALFRHLVARIRGEVLDVDSGLPHMAHAGCCLLFLAWHDNEGRADEVTNP